MDLFQAIGVLGFVLIGFGIMFQVFRPSAAVFFFLFLLFLPTLVSMVRGFGANLLHVNLPWQGWVVLIFAVLIGLRILIDSIFRR